MKNSSQLFKNTTVYIVLGFLPIGVNVILAPLYTHLLNPSEFALIGISTLLQVFVTFFISLSLDSAYARMYFNYEQKKELVNGFLSTLLLTVLLTFGIIAALFSFFGDYIFQLAFKNQSFRFFNFGLWTLLTAVASVIISFFSIRYRNEEKLKAFSVLNISFFVVPVLFTFAGIFLMNSRAEGAVVGRAVGSVAIMLVALGSFFRGSSFAFKRKYYQEAIRYSLPLIPYQLMFAAFANIDRLILERNFSAFEFGVYSFAILVTGVVSIYISSLSNAVFPRIYKYLSEDREATSIQKYVSIVTMSSQFVIVLCVAAIVPVMRILISKDYANSYQYIGSLFLSFIPYVHYVVVTLPLFYFGKTKVFPLISLCALLSGILFNYIFIPLIGIWSVCLSLYVIRGVQLLTAVLFARRFKYHSLTYMNQTKFFSVSFIILAIYNVLLALNYSYNIFIIDIVNLGPLISFLFLSFLFYRNEIGNVFAFSKFKTILRPNSLSN